MWKCENVKVSNTNTNWKLATLGLATLATLATFTTAFADEPADTDLTLGEVDLPVYIYRSNGTSSFRQPSDGIALISSKATGNRALRCPAVIQYCRKGEKVRAPTSDAGGLKVTFFPFIGKEGR